MVTSEIQRKIDPTFVRTYSGVLKTSLGLVVWIQHGFQTIFFQFLSSLQLAVFLVLTCHNLIFPPYIMESTCQILKNGSHVRSNLSFVWTPAA